MSRKTFSDTVLKKLFSVVNWLFAGGAATAVAFLAFLESKNIKIEQLVLRFFHFLQLQNVPLFIWLLLIIMTIYFYSISRKLKIVAGEFYDYFDHGLINWEYGGEGWSIQRGEDGYELSITDSQDGGIVNFGLGWDNYEFSFECKLLSYNVGWIVRARDRENYIMIQLSMIDDKITLNPHYRVRSGWWVKRHKLHASQTLIEKIKSLDWIKIRIIAFGNTVDLFMNGEKVLSHRIPDPLRLEVPKSFSWNGRSKKDIDKGETELISLSFPSGRVGFRCLGDEHALIRNVKVKPLFWDRKYL